MAAGPTDYLQLLAAAVHELQANVSAAEPAARTLLSELAEAAGSNARIAAYGVGREGLAVKGFAMRLFHMGLQASVVGEMTASRLGRGDLLLMSAGPGFFSTAAALAQQARQDGARVLLLTSQPPEHAAAARWADVVLRVPATCLPPAEPAGTGGGSTADAAAEAAPSPPHLEPSAVPAAARSPLLMGSSYELALQLFFDLVAQLLRQRLGLTEHDMSARHTNLE